MWRNSTQFKIPNRFNRFQHFPKPLCLRNGALAILSVETFTTFKIPKLSNTSKIHKLEVSKFVNGDPTQFPNISETSNLQTVQTIRFPGFHFYNLPTSIPQTFRSFAFSTQHSDYPGRRESFQNQNIGQPRCRSLSCFIWLVYRGGLWPENLAGIAKPEEQKGNPCMHVHQDVWQMAESLSQKNKARQLVYARTSGCVANACTYILMTIYIYIYIS